MLSYIFFTLFLLLVCSASSALAVYAGSRESTLKTVKNVEILKKGECRIKLEPGGGQNTASDNNKIKNVDSVFFVTVDNFLVAVAEAQYTKSGNGGDTHNLVAAYPETTDDWVEEIFKQGSDDICKNWNTQLTTTNANAQSFFTAKNVVYDKENKKIYLLAVNKASAHDKWEYTLFVGDVSSNNKATLINWTTIIDKKHLEFSKTKNFEKKLELTKTLVKSSSTDSGALVTKDGKIIFVLRAADDTNSKNVIVFVGLKKDSSENDPELEVLHTEESAEKCYPYLFLWGEKIVMIPTNCDANANQNVKESTDMKEWNNTSGTFYHFSDFFKDKTSFTTTVINDTNVLLFAKQNKKECSTAEEKCFTFWFSDGNRTYNVGEAVLENNENILSSSIIYADGKLFFFLHQQSDSSDDDKEFVLTRLDKQLENITQTLEKWERADQSVLKLCGTETSDFKTVCAVSLPTNGLVGFLSNKDEDSNKKWKDEYLYVNADIKGSATFENALKCNGKGQGATWPVGEGNENQAYKFTKYGFTLVATINIHQNSENSDNSLLGFVLNNNDERFGLWCSKNKKWTIYDEETKKLKDSTLECKEKTTYIVAVILNEKKLFVYVNWEKVTDFENEMKGIEETENIKYFYFGAGLDEGESQSTKSFVTVTNVLLYNRPFTTEKIIQLKPKKETTTADRQTTQPENDQTVNPGDSKIKTDTQLETSATKNGEEAQSSSPPPTTEDSAVRVGVHVFFLLFGVFTLLGRYVY